MVPVRRVSDPFEARVVAARLGSLGIVTQLRGGGIDGMYPFGAVEVLVAETDLEAAREVLLADEIESAFDDGEPGSPPSRLRAWTAILMVGLLLLTVVARVLSLAG
jgi:hypothetical protein